MDKYAAIQYLLDKCIIAVVRADSGGEDVGDRVPGAVPGRAECRALGTARKACHLPGQPFDGERGHVALDDRPACRRVGGAGRAVQLDA